MPTPTPTPPPPPRPSAQREKAAQALFAVDAREPPHADLRHALGDPIEVLVVEAVFDMLAHYFTHRRVGALALRHGANRDIAVGDHADQPVVFAHPQGAGVDRRPGLRHLPDRLTGRADLYLAGHSLAHS